MDIKIKDKDIMINSRGKPVMVEGVEKIVQQITVALAVKKGDFVYDRNMGVELSPKILLAENGAKTLQTILYEGLINVPDVCVTVNYVEKRDEKIYAGITVSNKYERKETEVIVFE